MPTNWHTISYQNTAIFLATYVRVLYNTQSQAAQNLEVLDIINK